MHSSAKDLPEESHYIQLESGYCHYRLDGPADGKLLVLIHGATVAGWIFEQLRPYLIKAKYRLLSVDLLGHGYSERLNTEYNIELYRRQVLELLTSIDEADCSKSISLLGHSLGAAVAVSLANEYPQRFRRVVLTAPLINFVENMPIVKLFTIPVLGEIINKLYVIPMLKRRRRKRYAAIADGQFIERFMSQFLISGFEQTVLSLFRSDVLADKTELYKAFSEKGVSSLVIYGEQDELVTPKQISHLKSIMPKSEFIGLADAGHAFILSEPERVATHIINFLKSKN